MRGATILVAVALGLACPRATAQGVGPHAGVGGLSGSAAGLDDGYTNFGGFVPLRQRNDGSLLYFDGGVSLYNQGNDFLGANLGLGRRVYSPLTRSILGGYVYYDRRATTSYDFDQIGCGLESLGSTFDARVNLNVPVGKCDYRYITGGGFSGGGFMTYANGLNALTVLDSELGAVLLARNHLQIRSFAGAYGLFDDKIKDTAGVRGRIEARIHDQCWLGGFIEDDNQFNTTGGLTFEFRFGRGRSAANNSTVNLLARLGDPVQRRKYVAVANTDASFLATAGGAALDFVHVVQGDSGLGLLAARTAGPSVASAPDGSMENPFTSLDDVATTTASIVYIHGGVYDGQAMVVNHPGQTVLSDTFDRTLVTDSATFVLPGSGVPVVISNSIGNAVTIAANNVTISGITISDAGASGIYANAVSNVKLTHNTITGSMNAGVLLDGVNSGTIFGNVVNGNGDYGMLIENRTAPYTFTGDIASNSFNDNAFVGLGVGGNVAGKVVDNTTNDNSFDGIFVSGKISGDLARNTATGNSRNGIYAGSVGGDVADNIANLNDSSGLLVANGTQGSVLRNTANDNGRYGVANYGLVGGDVADNQASRNGLEGITVDTLAGDLRNNTANDNGGKGMDAYFRVEGDVTGNTTNRNGGDGVAVNGSVTGNVIGNSTNTNADDGIDVDGTVGGTVSGNVASGNGDQGLEN